MCSDGRPGIVERVACEALVHLPELRRQVLGLAHRPSVAYTMDARYNIRGAEPKGGAECAPMVLPAWPPALWGGKAGKRALELVDTKCGAAFGDPHVLVDSFPALLRERACFRPAHVLRQGTVLVKDAGLGFCTERAEGGESGGGVWRACFTENALWSQLYTALLGEELLGQGRGGGQGEGEGGRDMEWPWKHPWQTAPLDCTEDMAGWACSARKRAVEARLAEIAGAPYPPCALAAQALAASRASWGTALLRNRYDLFEPHVLAEIVHAAGGGLLARVLRRLAADLPSHASGFPDILLWRAGGSGCSCAFGPQVHALRELLVQEQGAAGAEAAGGAAAAPCPLPASPTHVYTAAQPACAMVEVKSQNDKVHFSQLAWFSELKGLACVLKVLKAPRDARDRKGKA